MALMVEAIEGPAERMTEDWKTAPPLETSE